MPFLTPAPLTAELGTPLPITLTRADLMADLTTANGANSYFLTPADYSKWKSVTVILRSQIGKQIKVVQFDGQSDSASSLSLSAEARETVWNVVSATVYDFDGGSISIDKSTFPNLLNIYDFDLSPPTIIESETDSGNALIANVAQTSYYAQKFTASSSFKMTQFDMYAKNKNTLTGGIIVKLYDDIGGLIDTSDELLDASTISAVTAEYVNFYFSNNPQLTIGNLYEIRHEYTGVDGVDYGSQIGNLEIHGFTNTGIPSEHWLIGANDLGGAYNSTFNVWGK